MEKYNLLPEQLLHEGTIDQDNLFLPSPLSESVLLATHTQAYWEKLSGLNLSRSEERRTGFPLTESLVYREITIMDGTLQATLFALKFGIGMNIAGGTHHAFTNKGEGFCLLNDIAISANYLINKKHVEKILIVDLDVHQGNGTAEIFQDEARVFTFSMHGALNYPLKKEKSDLDIALPDGTGDTEYLAILEKNLDFLIGTVEPDFVFFQSGVDVLGSDKLGRLDLTISGCKERDRVVLEKCKINNIPVTVSMGGGYSEKITHIIEAHSNTFRLAQHIFF